jgi:hypothetical protein
MIFSLREEEYIILESRHVLQRALILIYGCLLFSWSMLTLIRNFSEELFHVSFWLAYDIIYVVICALTIGFTLRVGSKGDIGLDPRRSISLSNFCIFLSVVAIANNLTHFIFTIVDISDGVTTASYWFVVAFSALLAVLALLDGLGIFYWVKYREIVRNLRRKER